MVCARKYSRFIIQHAKRFAIIIIIATAQSRLPFLVEIRDCPKGLQQAVEA
jgi:hypothetical protein